MSKLKAFEPIQVRPGYFIINDTRATGGKTSQVISKTSQAINGGDGLQEVRTRVNEVDHVEACKAVDAVEKKAGDILRAQCATMIGGKLKFCTADKLPVIVQLFNDLRLEAATVNAAATAAGSERQVTVAFVPAEVQIDNEDTALAVARTIRETLTRIRDALRSGKVTGGGAENLLRAPLQAARNLDRLAVGIVSDMVRDALSEIQIARTWIKDQIAAGSDAATAGAAVALPAIEDAIAWVTPGGISGATGAGGTDGGGFDPDAIGDE